MIKSLFIKNFILVDEIKVLFTNGLNIITGETGAGKSIIVNAIGQLCGERGSPELVRTGTKRAIVEAEIDLSGIEKITQKISELDLDLENESPLLIRKELNAGGSSRIFINDSPVNLSTLSALSSMIFDFHGQHQHQRLLNPDYHIEYLDSFGGYDNLLKTFSENYAKYVSDKAALDEFKSRQLKSFQQQDMYRYQNEELTKAQLDEQELDQLRAELKVLSNVENLHQIGNNLNEILYSGEINAGDLLSTAEDHLEDLAKMDDQFAALKSNLSEARATVEEIGRFTEQYLSGLEFDPERMEYIHQRISQLEFLLKKYQKLTIQELIGWHEEIKQMLGDIDQYDDEIKQKEIDIQKLIGNLEELGKQISEKRKEAGSIFRSKITEILTQIGMPQAKFRIDQSFVEDNDSPFKMNGKKVKISETGFDKIIFEIASNAGENFYPLHRIASGGEISRIMLAIKATLSEADQIPTLIFDEIDSGISGKIAQIVGKNLSELSNFHQIICVTHLPQIAAFSKAHYKVAKQMHENRTVVDIIELNEEDQIKEIANLLGGVDLSSHAVENARHLILESKKI